MAVKEDLCRSEQRKQAFQDYIDGKPVAFLSNPKGLYELYSPDGKELYTLDYLMLRKSTLQMDGKPVMFKNVFQYVPFTEHGTPATQTIYYLRNRLDGVLVESFKGYEVIYLGADKDMKTIDLSGYVLEMTQTIYSSLRTPGHNYHSIYAEESFQATWPHGLVMGAKRALSLIKHLKLTSGITSMHKSLEEIGNGIKPR